MCRWIVACALMVVVGIIAVASATSEGNDQITSISNELPAAVKILGVSQDQILSAEEAASIRGQALSDVMPETIMPEAMAARYDSIVQRATVTEHAGGVFSFGDVYFGDDFMFNANTGRGSIYAPETNSLVTLYNMTGIHSLYRNEIGMFVFNGYGGW